MLSHERDHGVALPLLAPWESLKSKVSTWPSTEVTLNVSEACRDAVHLWPGQSAPGDRRHAKDAKDADAKCCFLFGTLSQDVREGLSSEQSHLDNLSCSKM